MTGGLNKYDEYSLQSKIQIIEGGRLVKYFLRISRKSIALLLALTLWAAQ